MDPVSLTVSVVSLIQAVKALVGYLKDIQSAPRDRLDLLEGLAGLQTLLESINGRMTATAEARHSLESVHQLATPNGPFQQLESALMRLQTKLRPGRLQRLTWSLEKSDIRQSLWKIERAKTLLLLALQDDHLALSLAIQDDVQGLSDQIERMDHGIQQIQELQDLTESSRSNCHRMQTQTEYTPGTGHWLLTHETFGRWIDGNVNILWCRGGPGVGKTVLASIIFDHLKEQSMCRDDVGVVSIYCDYKEQADQSATALVASIIHQIVEHRPCLSDHFVALQDDFSRRHRRPSLDDLTRALHLELATYSCVYIIVDAFDECSEVTGARSKFLFALRSLPRTARLLITSRDIMSIAQQLSIAEIIEIQARPDELRMYIEQRISSEARLGRLINHDTALQETIVASVTRQVSGMFLLVRLHMDSLTSKHNKKSLLAALSTLPKEIEESYDETLSRIRMQSAEDCALAFRVLSWLTHAQRSLRVRELQHALAVSPETAEMDLEDIVEVNILTSVCAGLVIVDSSSSVIHLVHSTAQEYFERHRESVFHEAHYHIAATCLTYLSFNSRSADTPFLQYAARYWGCHAAHHETQVLQQILQFLQDRQRLDNTFQTGFTVDFIFTSMWPWPKPRQTLQSDVTSVHTLAIFGLGHRSVVEILLGRKVDTEVKNSAGMTALFHAIIKGHYSIAILLLQSGALPNAQDIQNRTPLFHTADLPMAKILLEREDVHGNAQDTEKRTVIHYMIQNGRIEILELLLQRPELEINQQDINGHTPLITACALGNANAVKLLLDHQNIISDLCDSNGMTPLMHASKHGHESGVSDPGHDLVHDVAMSGSEHSSLRDAAAQGLEAVMQLLLMRNNAESSAPRNLESKRQLSRGKGVDVIRPLLQDKRVDINAQDHSGRSVLSYAAECGDLDLVIYLLDVEDIKHIPDMTLLSYAASYGCTRTVELLLSTYGVAPDNGDLRHAAAYGNDKVVESLLRHQAYASEYGHNEVGQLLHRAKDGYEIDEPSDESDSSTVSASSGDTASSSATYVLLPLQKHEVLESFPSDTHDLRHPYGLGDRRDEEIIELLVRHGVIERPDSPPLVKDLWTVTPEIRICVKT
ncbi:ankyrin repeat-containing domain protein, partial [Mycena floridula]